MPCLATLSIYLNEPLASQTKRAEASREAPQKASVILSEMKGVLRPECSRRTSNIRSASWHAGVCSAIVCHDYFVATMGSSPHLSSNHAQTQGYPLRDPPENHRHKARTVKHRTSMIARRNCLFELLHPNSAEYSAHLGMAAPEIRYQKDRRLPENRSRTLCNSFGDRSMRELKFLQISPPRCFLSYRVSRLPGLPA